MPTKLDVPGADRSGFLNLFSYEERTGNLIPASLNPGFGKNSLEKKFPFWCYKLMFLNLMALPITDTELKLIARAAIMGESNSPKNGYKTPAAMGIPKIL